MRGCTATLLLCALSAAQAAATPAPRARSPAPRARSPAPPASPPALARSPRALSSTAVSSADFWRNFINEYSRGALQVPLQGDNNGRTSLSVLLIPVPVPVAAPATLVPAPTAPAPSATTAPTLVLAPSFKDLFNNFNFLPFNPIGDNQYPSSVLQPVPTSGPAPSAPAAPPSPRPPPAEQEDRPLPPPPWRPQEDAIFAKKAPHFPPVEDSRVLVEQFRAQEPEDPSLPPVLIEPVGVISSDDYTEEELVAAGALAAPEPVAPEPARGRLRCARRRAVGESGSAPAPAAPPLPRFERSLFLRARLTVPRADYTEPYSVWWDAASGAARVDFHGGSTSSYRLVRGDGRVRSVLVRTDRTGPTDVRRCVLSEPRDPGRAERALPALPDLRAFHFAGYVVRGEARAERWRHTLSGHAGELGGARGEALTFRHELLLARSPDQFSATPLWYSVRVDSSVLGPDCDGYVHHFDEVQEGHQDSSLFRLDIADACDQFETTNSTEPLEPLREYTLLRREPRYDAALDRFKRQYGRTYADNVEETVRKNVLIQSMRFSASANRQGASMSLASNFLSDRLAVELQALLGVAPAADAPPGEPFPHAPAELSALRGRLARGFDWRALGGVTPVRSQLPTCQACWAFSTVGAVEGVLFKETGRLVPLSEQVLVDCGHRNGAHGCDPTWPTFAYEYIKSQGLPALEDYTYEGQVQQCRADSVPVVTHISGHINVTANNILALKVAIKQHGPTVVIFDGQAHSLQLHRKGYYHDGRCRKNSLNHAALAVGWETHRGETYFILKNSWSRAWGEDGYVRMRAASNTCGVLRRPSVPSLSSRDVKRVPATARVADSG